jgi:hypothetical protein
MAAGGFDERFRVPSVEDIDLGMRLAASGERIVLDPLLQGTHLKAWSIAEMIRTDFARRGVPWIRLLLRDRRLASSGQLNLGWPHRLSALASLIGLAGLILRRPGAVVAMAVALVAINRPFYRLLGRHGLATAVAGVGLHAIHHLTGAAAVPAGVIAHLLDGQRRSAGVEPWPDRSGPDRVSVRRSG